MALAVRAMTDLGMERFGAYLARLRKGEQIDPPHELLEGSGHTRELPVELKLERRDFASRLELASYLCENLQALEADAVDRNPGLWAWLSLFLFDKVCPAGPEGTRRPGQDYRHIPDFGYRHRLRHLLYGPYLVYRRHGSGSRLLLSGPVHREGGIYHDITSRQDLIANAGVVEAATLLYYDPRRDAPKPGAQRAPAALGTVRRFVRVLQQLDLTYDIYGLSGAQILELLPAEFDRWRAGNQQLAATASDEPGSAQFEEGTK